MVIRAIAPNGDVETAAAHSQLEFQLAGRVRIFAQPVELPRGTTIEMRYRYDNTSENPHNPSTPPRRVVFGSETSDEMGELLVQVLPKKPADAPVLKAQVARKNLLTDVAGEEKRLADVPGDYETHNALGVAYVAARTPGGCARAVRGRARAGAAASRRRTTTSASSRWASSASPTPSIISSGRWRRGPTTPRRTTNLGVAFEAIGRPRDAEQQYRDGAVRASESRGGAQQPRAHAAQRRETPAAPSRISAPRSRRRPTTLTRSTTSGGRWPPIGRPREAAQVFAPRAGGAPRQRAAS